MNQPPILIVGLGNPGAEHARDRHNVGYWFVDGIARSAGASFRAESKFQGNVCQVSLGHTNVRLLKPTTFMNCSGQSLRRVLDYYKLEPEHMLVVHDELDQAPGSARLKRGGGHGGHNGLRDVVAHCGKEFLRLRIGIGHPGSKNKVTAYVLRPPREEELDLILDAMGVARRAVDTLYTDGLEQAMHYLHTETPREPISTEK